MALGKENVERIKGKIVAGDPAELDVIKLKGNFRISNFPCSKFYGILIENLFVWKHDWKQNSVYCTILFHMLQTDSRVLQGMPGFPRGGGRGPREQSGSEGPLDYSLGGEGTSLIAKEKPGCNDCICCPNCIGCQRKYL